MIKHKILLIWLTSCFALGLFQSLPCANAAEGICPSGPLGGTDISQAILPPPGLYASIIAGGIDLPQWHMNDGTRVDSSGTVLYTGIGMMYAYETPVLGGQVASTLFAGVQDQDFGIDGYGKNQSSGLIDMYSDLFLWSRFMPSQAFLKQPKGSVIPYGTGVLLGLGVTVPTGEYDASAPLNVGSNFFTLSPSAAITYTVPSLLGSFLGEATQFSSRIFYNYYTENNDTDYKSGATVSADFSITQIKGLWQYGIAGFAFSQVEDDEIRGVTGGTRSSAFNIGPVIARNFMVGQRFFSGKLKLMTTLDGRNITKSHGFTFSIGTKF